jgi:hypothetical protein
MTARPAGDTPRVTPAKKLSAGLAENGREALR